MDNEILKIKVPETINYKNEIYFVKNFTLGNDPYKRLILYAEVVDAKDQLICSATVEFILSMYYDRANQVVNYKQTLEKYIDHNNIIKDELYYKNIQSLNTQN